MNVLKQDDEEVKAGRFQSGDKRFFFQASQSNLDRGNKIYHDSKWYEIMNVLPFSFNDTRYAVEVLTSKI